MQFPFITGSRVYGIPTEESDIDLVLPPNGNSDFKKIMVGFSDDQNIPIKYGRLNLILTNELKQWELWLQATNELIAMKPVTREFAIEHITNLFKSHGLAKSIAYDEDPN